MKKLAIIGAGGLGREVSYLVERINKAEGVRWDFIGFYVEGQYAKGPNVSGVIDDLNQISEPLDVVIAIGIPQAIKRISESLTNPLISFPNLLSPDIDILDSNKLSIGKGNIFKSACFISCDVAIGDFNIFNGSISVGHDTTIGSYNAIMPAVRVSGNVTIGDENYFGVNSVVLEKIKIGNNITLGAGSVLMRKTQDGNLYIGNPAIKTNF